LHGDADSVVALQSARRTAAWWADALGAQPSRPVRVKQRGARRAMRVTEWRARGKAQVVLREIEGLGHAWSGGAARTAHSDPSGPDATALIWAFMACQFVEK
jgi:poly(3-hydroxybutyrate) depolymerase